MDPSILQAYGHKTRQAIIRVLDDAGELSRAQITDRVEERLANVSYHVRVLKEAGVVELTRTRPVRGALVVREPGGPSRLFTHAPP